ncbi:META domain-containing protein [Rheinheimera sp. WS51]|uniref:META domain-containing protein n=1 Tax=Rheinheimera sp. WS51 TaxID=3425886 RepID=UPI003D8C0B40
MFFSRSLVFTTIALLAACQQINLPEGQYKQLSNSTEQKPLHIALQEGKLSGFTGCNNAMGNYHIDKGELVVSQLATTMMMCEPEAMAKEQAFSQFLQSRPQVSIDQETLTLSKGDVQYQFNWQPEL